MHAKTGSRGFAAAFIAALLFTAGAVSGHSRGPDERSGDMRAGAPEGHVSVPASADTWYEIDVGTGVPVNPDPQGADTSLRGGWWDTGIDERIVMRFAISSDLLDSPLVKAELEIHILAAAVHTYSPPQVTSGTLSIALRDVTGPWTELGLSSVNPPNVGPVLRRIEIPWGPCGVDGCGSVRIDVTDFVERWLDDPAQLTNGLALHASGISTRPALGTTFRVGSRESDRGSTLQLELAGPHPSDTPTAVPPAAPVYLPVGRS